MSEQPPYAELLTLLERDWYIEASWDDLRGSWYIGWTDECKDHCRDCSKATATYVDLLLYPLRLENERLRKLVADYNKCLDTALCLASDAGYPVMPDQKLFDSLHPRMRELGVEEA